MSLENLDTDYFEPNVKDFIAAIDRIPEKS